VTTTSQAFARFLADTVNLPQASLDKLETHVNGLWSAMANSEYLPNRPKDWQQQGSWAYSTIIKPRPGRDFDADIVLEFDDSNIEPKEYLLRIRRALENHGVYEGKTELKNRCVRVNYAGEHHVDLVPLICIADRDYIVNRQDNVTERAEPVAYAEWFNQRDSWSGTQLHKVVRLSKYLRDTKGTHSTKSVILTTLLAGRIEQGDSFSTTARALCVLIRRLSDYLGQFQFKPSLPDPACDKANFDHRWTQSEFETLRTVVSSLADRIDEAEAASTAEVATGRWRALFGDAFPEISVVSTATSLAVRAPTETLPEEAFRAVNPTHTASIRAEVAASGRRKAKLLGRDGIVDRNRTLNFSVTTDAPGDYEVHWKVRNYGSEASKAGGLRGEIALGARDHTESTLYRGRHFIEAYIVKDRVVVAKARRYVTIR
jgi:hypothetical protein